MSFRKHISPIRFAELEQTIRIGDDFYTVAFRGSTETWMRLLYPDILEVTRLSKHLASVTGRTRELSLDLVQNFMLIKETLQLDGEEPLDVSEIAKLYSENPLLFFKLVGAANVAIGNTESISSGQAGWMRVLNELNSCMRATNHREFSAGMHSIRQQVVAALEDYFPSDAVSEMTPSAEDVDRAMELALGNSHAPEGASREASPIGA